MAKANKPSDPPKIQDSFAKEIINPNFKGQEIIKFIAKTLPQKPGVYQMENEKGDILYIGKANAKITKNGEPDETNEFCSN